MPIDAGHRIASGVTETEYTDCGNVTNRVWFDRVKPPSGDGGEREWGGRAVERGPGLGSVRVCHGDDAAGAQCRGADRERRRPGGAIFMGGITSR